MGEGGSVDVADIDDSRTGEAAFAHMSVCRRL
jgi:hypothetical protein